MIRSLFLSTGTNDGTPFLIPPVLDPLHQLLLLSNTCLSFKSKELFSASLDQAYGTSGFGAV